MNLAGSFVRTPAQEHDVNARGKHNGAKVDPTIFDVPPGQILMGNSADIPIGRYLLGLLRVRMMSAHASTDEDEDEPSSSAAYPAIDFADN